MRVEGVTGPVSVSAVSAMRGKLKSQTVTANSASELAAMSAAGRKRMRFDLVENCSSRRTVGERRRLGERVR